MTNKYTGEVSLQIDGTSRALVYNWRALAELQTTFGADTDKTLGNLSKLDLPVLATILSIGLKKHHPDLTAERLLDLPLSLVPTMQAMDKALHYAYFGADGVPEAPAPDALKKDAKKKTI